MRSTRITQRHIFQKHADIRSLQIAQTHFSEILVFSAGRHLSAENRKICRFSSVPSRQKNLLMMI